MRLGVFDIVFHFCIIIPVFLSFQCLCYIWVSVVTGHLVRYFFVPEHCVGKDWTVVSYKLKYMSAYSHAFAMSREKYFYHLFSRSYHICINFKKTFGMIFVFSIFAYTKRTYVPRVTDECMPMKCALIKQRVHNLLCDIGGSCVYARAFARLCTWIKNVICFLCQSYWSLNICGIADIYNFLTADINNF